MINLLSTDHKNELRAARVNVFLSRYIGIFVLAVVFLMGVLFVSHTLLKQTMTAAEDRIESNDVKASVYSETKQQVDALSAELSEAKTILDQSVSYASVLTKLGQAMPPGTVIESLTLNNEALSGTTQTELIAYAKTEEDAILINQQLQSSSLFSQVQLDGTDAAGGIANYPIKVTLKVTFNRSGAL